MISLPDLAYKRRARRALLVGARQAVVYQWQDDLVMQRAVFDAGEDGRQGFRRYLAEEPEMPCYLLVDLVDEEYRLDTVPRLSRRDRQALLRRKAARIFKDTGYYYFKVTGREKTGRRDERVLLSALANPGAVRQWVAILDEARSPLASICSLPLFSAQLLKNIAGRNDGCRLLVSLQSVSGLRQTCFDNGEFQFSRLVWISHAEQVGAEVEKVLRYLESRRPDQPAETLHVHFLVAGALSDQLKAALKQQESVCYHFCDPHQPADENASREPVFEPFSDAYFIRQFFKLRPGNVYAGMAERRWFILGRLRAGVAASGFAILLGSAGWSALNIYRGLALYPAVSAAEEQTHKYTADYEQARKRLPKTPVDASELKTVVMIADSLAQQKTSPLGMVAAISRSLRGFPSIQLNSIAWKTTDDPDAIDGADKDDTGLPDALNVPGADRSRYQVALLKGRVEPFDGNYREAMDAINRFADDLRGQQAMHAVAVGSLPLELSSGAHLQGNTQSLQRRADFTLKVVLQN